MNVHFFFQGKLSREEASSAFLATLLAQRPDFRAYFFNRCGVAEGEFVPGYVWNVVTEDREFDVLMQCPESAWVVLIENKIKRGAVTPGQLSGYYRKLRNENNNASKKILLVYLTPKPGTGSAEFLRLKNSAVKVEGDCFAHLSWDDVFEYASQLEKADVQRDFITSGFGAIKQHIDSALQEKYCLTGGREILDETAAWILREIGKACPYIQFRRWRGADASPVYTVKSDLTVYLKAITKYDDQTYEPVGLLNPDGTLNVTLEVSMNVSGSGRRKPLVCQRWGSMTKDGVIEVPSLGRMVPSDVDQGWFVWRTEVSVTKEQVQSQLLYASKAVLKHMEAFFSVE